MEIGPSGQLPRVAHRVVEMEPRRCKETALTRHRNMAVHLAQAIQQKLIIVMGQLALVSNT